MGGVIFLLLIVGYVNNILIYDYTDACRIAKFSNRPKDIPSNQQQDTRKSYC